MDVCTVKPRAPQNGYMLSTFSPAESVLASRGDQAIFDGAYAQCDGGICFTSTEGKSFPGSTSL
jgi:hypothetical protein